MDNIVFVVLFQIMAECGSQIYYREAISRMDGSKNWTDYYATLIGTNLIFDKYDNKTRRLVQENMIELNKNTICSISSKNCHGFPFVIQTNKEKFYLKSVTKSQRQKWLQAIRSSIAKEFSKPTANKNTQERTRRQTLPARSHESKTSGAERNSRRPIERRSSTGLRNGVTDSKKDSSNISSKQSNAGNISLNGNLLSATKKQTTNSSSAVQRPQFVRSKSDLSAVIENDSVSKNRMVRAESSDLEIERRKSDQKTVKWDLRSVISNTFKPDSNPSGRPNNQEKQNHPKSATKSQPTDNLKDIILENKYTRSSSSESTGNETIMNSESNSPKPLKSCLNNDRKHSRHLSADNFSISSGESISTRRGSDLNDLLLETLVSTSKNFEDNQEMQQTYQSKNSSYDEAIKTNFGSWSPNIRFSSNGNIELFDNSPDNQPFTRFVTSDRFGNQTPTLSSFIISAETTANLGIPRRLKPESRAWSAINLLAKHETTPTRREHSAPLLRFSRHKNIVDGVL